MRIAATLALLLLFAGAPALAQPADPAAEIAFWNSVKDSKSPAEIKAYLDKYPNGTFADLARIRMKNLESAPAPAPGPAASQPSPTPKAADTASALTSPEIVREVANRLYNLNYDVPPAASVVDADFRDAIRRWQSVTKRAETGDMTAADVAYLRSATPPTTWGSMAYNISGGATTVWNRTSRATSEQEALKGCADLKGGKCNVISAISAGCGALGYYSGTAGGQTHRGAFAEVRGNIAQAIDRALETCRTKARVPANCAVRTTFCANGSHKQ